MRVSSNKIYKGGGNWKNPAHKAEDIPMGVKQQAVTTIEIVLGGRTLIPERQPDEKIVLRENIGHRKIGEVIGDILEIKIRRTIYWRFRVPLQAFYIDCPFDGELNAWAVCPLKY